jgi:hypothetical protein
VPIPLNHALLKKDGWTDAEIDQIQKYVDEQTAAGTFNHAVELVELNGMPRAVCRTVAQILDKLRPGTWIKGG